MVENRGFCLPHLHSKPRLGGSPLEYCHNNVWYGKTRIVPLPDGEKFISTEYTNVTDRQTDRQTDGLQTNTARRHRPRLRISSRGKNTPRCRCSCKTEIVCFVYGANRFRCHGNSIASTLTNGPVIVETTTQRGGQMRSAVGIR